VSDQVAWDRAIAGAPDDTTLRLVYADWLEDGDRNPREARRQRLIAKWHKDALGIGQFVTKGMGVTIADWEREGDRGAWRHTIAGESPHLPEPWAEFAREIATGWVGGELIAAANLGRGWWVWPNKRYRACGECRVTRLTDRYRRWLTVSVGYGLCVAAAVTEYERVRRAIKGGDL
jgi:uncharacterized protein (TIGR02996 family)